MWMYAKRAKEKGENKNEKKKNKHYEYKVGGTETNKLKGKKWTEKLSSWRNISQRRSWKNGTISVGWNHFNLPFESGITKINKYDAIPIVEVQRCFSKPMSYGTWSLDNLIFEQAALVYIYCLFHPPHRIASHSTLQPSNIQAKLLT